MGPHSSLSFILPLGSTLVQGCQERTIPGDCERDCHQPWPGVVWSPFPRTWCGMARGHQRFQGPHPQLFNFPHPTPFLILILILILLFFQGVKLWFLYPPGHPPLPTLAPNMNSKSILNWTPNPKVSSRVRCTRNRRYGHLEVSKTLP